MGPCWVSAGSEFGLAMIVAWGTFHIMDGPLSREVRWLSG